jgi:hypothetical protein
VVVLAPSYTARVEDCDVRVRFMFGVILRELAVRMRGVDVEGVEAVSSYGACPALIDKASKYGSQ